MHSVRPSSPSLSVMNQIRLHLDKLRIGRRHSMHQWGPFCVHYHDGSKSRRQSWSAAKKLSQAYGGHIYHIPSQSKVASAELQINLPAPWLQELSH